MANPKKNLNRRVIHIELPVKMWAKFVYWCVEQGHGSLTAGVKELIRNITKE